jgi:hypothetical protein
MKDSDQLPDEAEADVAVDADVGLIDEMLRMSPSDRLRQNDRMAALAAKLRGAFLAKEREWKARTS